MKQYNLINCLSKLSWKKSFIFLPAPFLSQIETVKYPLVCLILVIGVDLITSLIAYFCRVKRNYQRSLTFNDYRYGIISGGLRQTVKKSYQYGMAIIVVFIIEVFGFGGDISFNVPLVNIDAGLTQFVAWAFAMIEVKSIDENLKKVSGKSFINSIVSIVKSTRKIISGVKDSDSSS